VSIVVGRFLSSILFCPFYVARVKPTFYTIGQLGHTLTLIENVRTTSAFADASTVTDLMGCSGAFRTITGGAMVMI